MIVLLCKCPFEIWILQRFCQSSWKFSSDHPLCRDKFSWGKSEILLDNDKGIWMESEILSCKGKVSWIRIKGVLSCRGKILWIKSRLYIEPITVIVRSQTFSQRQEGVHLPRQVIFNPCKIILCKTPLMFFRLWGI